MAGQAPAAGPVSADQLATAINNAVPKKGKRCFRCGDVAHRMAECTAVICDYCEGPEHVNGPCPLLSAPKPKIQIYGYAHEELLFFESELTATYTPRLENYRLASLVVSKGEMTIPRIILQLQRLVPADNFVWEVQQIGHNIYKVQFPTRTDLERLQVFGTFRVPNSECEMTFDSWAHAPEPMETLPEIWVRVSGIPWIHRGDFLALWPIGDMFGKTLKIDMKYTRKHGVLRILVGCLNWSKIPKRFPLFIKDGFYNLSFDIEGEDRPEVEDMETDDQRKDDNDGDDDLGEDFKEVLEKDGQLANAASEAGSAARQGNPASGRGDAPPTH